MGCMKLYDEKFNICPYCGTVFNAPPDEPIHMVPGSILAKRYIVGRVLGHGGFGVTYIGYDPVLEKRIAVKEYLPGEFATRMPNAQTLTVYTGDREEQFRIGREKVLDEARRLAKVQNAPNVVHIYDTFEENNTAYIIMELLDGQSVKELMAQNGRMPLDLALHVVMQVIAGMKEVHRTGLLHRDISPDNIYILKDGTVKILDFGAARYATSSHSKSLSVIVKPGYSPEEQYRSRGDQGTWTDVYALAATFYKMLTGITPDDALERSVRDTLQPPSALGIQIPEGMETALMNALNVAIEDRTRTMEEFEEELLADTVRKREITDRTQDTGRISMKAVAAIGIGAALALCMLVAALIGPRTGMGPWKIPAGYASVPNLVNLAETEAVRSGRNAGVTVLASSTSFSAVIPEGSVVGQDVKVGTLVKRGSEVGVELSRGREKVQVPSVQGMELSAAQARLEDAGFKVEHELVSAPGFAPGTVVTQSAGAGTTAVKGSTVRLEAVKEEPVEETAAAAAAGEAMVPCVVPELSGKTFQEAGELCMRESLFIAAEYVYDAEVPADTVISQDEQAGTELDRGSTVRVRVSKGPEMVQVPYGIRATMTEDEAVKTLTDLGFEVSTKKEYASVAEGRVSRLSVSEGEALVKGSPVELWISRGPEPVPEETKAKRKETAPPATQALQTAEAPPPETAPPETAAPETAPPETAPPETAPPETQPETAAASMELWTQPVQQTQAETPEQTYLHASKVYKSAKQRSLDASREDAENASIAAEMGVEYVPEVDADDETVDDDYDDDY